MFCSSHHPVPHGSQMGWSGCLTNRQSTGFSHVTTISGVQRDWLQKQEISNKLQVGGGECLVSEFLWSACWYPECTTHPPWDRCHESHLRSKDQWGHSFGWIKTSIWIQDLFFPWSSPLQGLHALRWHCSAGMFSSFKQRWNADGVSNK